MLLISLRSSFLNWEGADSWLLILSRNIPVIPSICFVTKFWFILANSEGEMKRHNRRHCIWACTVCYTDKNNLQGQKYIILKNLTRNPLKIQNRLFYIYYTPRKLCIYPPQTLFGVGILFSRCPCVCACVRPSVTFCFFNILKSHCWIFIKPCKHVHICKTNTLDKKVRARGQFYERFFPF